MDNYETPKVIQDLCNLDYHTEDGFIDFEPFGNFLSPEKTAHWLSCWTGNPDYEGEDLRVFGQDGSGGYFTFWLKKNNTDILQQPVVFFGSEGELYVVSANFSDFLWCLNTGLSYSDDPTDYIVTESISNFVKNNTTTLERKPSVIFEEANELFPDFKSYILSKVMY